MFVRMRSAWCSQCGGGLVVEAGLVRSMIDLQRCVVVPVGVPVCTEGHQWVPQKWIVGPSASLPAGVPVPRAAGAANVAILVRA